MRSGLAFSRSASKPHEDLKFNNPIGNNLETLTDGNVVIH